MEPLLANNYEITLSIPGDNGEKSKTLETWVCGLKDEQIGFYLNHEGNTCPVGDILAGLAGKAVNVEVTLFTRDHTPVYAKRMKSVVLGEPRLSDLSYDDASTVTVWMSLHRIPQTVIEYGIQQ
jgi:hypothetical protein